MRELLDSSQLLRITRSAAIEHLKEALQRLPTWQPRYRIKGTKTVRVAPPPPFKFLDIGTKMGFSVEGLTPDLDRSSVHHPKSGERIPVVNTVHTRLAKTQLGEPVWCDETAWTCHSSEYDFQVSEPLGNIWGLPILIPTFPGKLFEQGTRHEDIVTDTLHTSSSDLITWNTLTMIKADLTSSIKLEWIQIVTASLQKWDVRDQLEPFQPDSRRGFALHL